MDTIMIDATHRNVGNVPVSTPTVAGYVTGTPDIQWTPLDWNRFPHSGMLRIDQSPELAAYGSNAASVANIEQGAGTVSAFIGASKARLRLGRMVWFYCDETTFGQVSAALRAAGMPLDKCGVWLANWNLSEAGAKAILGMTITGIRVIAVQWASPSSNPRTQVPGSDQTLQEAQVDLSVTVPGWFEYFQKQSVPAKAGAVSA